MCSALSLVFNLRCDLKFIFFNKYTQKVCPFQYKFWNYSTRYMGRVNKGKGNVWTAEICEALKSVQREESSPERKPSVEKDTVVWKGPCPWRWEWIGAAGRGESRKGRRWEWQGSDIKNILCWEFSKLFKIGVHFILFSESYKELPSQWWNDRT